MRYESRRWLWKKVDASPPSGTEYLVVTGPENLLADIDESKYVQRGEHEKVVEELAAVKARLDEERTVQAQQQQQVEQMQVEQQQVQQQQQQQIQSYGEFFKRFEQASKVRAEQRKKE